MSIRGLSFGFVLAGSIFCYYGILVFLMNVETPEGRRKADVHGPAGLTQVPDAFKPTYYAESDKNPPAKVTEELMPEVEVVLPWESRNKNVSGVFSPDGKYFACSYPDGAYQLFTNIYNLQTGEWVFGEKEALSYSARDTQMTFYHTHFAPLAFSSDSCFCAYVTRKGIVLWDLQEKKRHDPLSGLPLQNGNHIPAIRALRFSEDGKQIIARVGGSSIISQNENDYVWDVAGGPPELFTGPEDASASGKRKIFFTSDDLHRTKPPAYSSDGKFFAHNVERDKSSGLIVCDARTEKELCAIPLTETLTAAAFLPDSHILVTAISLIPGDVNHYSHDILYPSFGILEFWDVSQLVWDKHRGSTFPKKIRACYFGKTREATYDSGNTQVNGLSITKIIPSPDGSRMYLGVEGLWISFSQGERRMYGHGNPEEITRDGKKYCIPGYIVPVSPKKDSGEMMMQ